MQDHSMELKDASSFFGELLLDLFFPLESKMERSWYIIVGAAKQRADEGAGEGLRRQGQRPPPHGYKWQDKC